MKHVTKPSAVLTMKDEPVKDIPVSDISVSRLIDDGLLALYREMRNLLTLSARGKLDAASSRDLRDTIKLLFEIQLREKESLQGLTDEQLQDKLKVAMKESNGNTE